MRTGHSPLAAALAGLEIEPLELSHTSAATSLEALGDGQGMAEMAASCCAVCSCCVSCCCCCCCG